MQTDNYDQQLNNLYGRGAKKRSKKPRGFVLKKPLMGRLPENVIRNGEVFIKTTDNLTKKAAKKEAKQLAKESGASKKEIKKAGNIAKQTVTAAKVMAKAEKKGVASKKGQKLVAKAEKIKALDGKSRVGTAIKKAIGTVTLTPLIPLVPVMNNALKKKGFTPPKNLADKAELFYNEIVKKGNNSFESRDLYYDGYNDNLVTVEIVGAIVGFVKNILTKKKEKKDGNTAVELSPIEQIVADGSEKVVAKIEAEAQDSGMNVRQLRKKLPGSNSSDSDESGAATPEEESEREGKQSRKPKGKGSSKKEAISFKSPIVIGGIALGGLALVMALKK